jgi:hypothetical protein
MTAAGTAWIKRIAILGAVLALVGAPPALARHYHPDRRNGPESGLADATVLLIRHAEKPGDGPGLAPQGEARANGYADYFRHLRVDGSAIHVDALMATADSSKSQRPRLTLEPLSRAMNLPIERPFADDEVEKLAKSLRHGDPGRTVLIAWHHGQLPKLISELGGDPALILPDGQWPAGVYDWVVVLRYDSNGQVMSDASRLVREPASLAASVQ